MNSSESKKTFWWGVRNLFWTYSEHRLRFLWRLGGLGVLVILLTILSEIVLSPLQSLSDEPPPFFGQMLFNLVFIVAAWMAVRFFDRRKFSETGIQINRNWWRDFGFGLALGAGLMAVIFFVELGAGWLTISNVFFVADSSVPFGVSILMPIVFFILVGIAEELVFRGYFLLNLAESLNFKRLGPRGALLAAWVITSALFGIAHAANPGATFVSSSNIFFAGLWLGFPYILTGSLAISIGAHISWNFFQGNVFGFQVSGTNIFSTTVVAIEQHGPVAWTGGVFGPEGGWLGLIGMVVGSLIILLWVRAQHGKISLFEGIAIPPVREDAGKDM